MSSFHIWLLTGDWKRRDLAILAVSAILGIMIALLFWLLAPRDGLTLLRALAVGGVVAVVVRRAMRVYFSWGELVWGVMGTDAAFAAAGVGVALGMEQALRWVEGVPPEWALSLSAGAVGYATLKARQWYLER